MIGLFDSGLGGLTVLTRVRELLPCADVLFFADQANVPYGDRTHAELLELLRANLRRLNDLGAAAIIMACNTSCAIGERYGWPDSRAPVLDLIESAALTVQREGYRRVGVVATAATVGAGSYGRSLRARVEGIDVVEVPAPGLVPLVERGATEGEAAHCAVAEVAASLPLDLDALVYGCTHYPLLERHFRAAVGAGVALVDPAVEQAKRAAALLGGGVAESGTTTYLTSGDEPSFKAGIARIMGAEALL